MDLVIFILAICIIVFGISGFCFWMAYRNLVKLLDQCKKLK